MKIVYCTHSTYAPGGMERVLANKISYLAEHNPEWELMVVTTDQKGREPYYRLPEKVVTEDLGINYSDDNEKSAAGKIAGYLRKKRLHRRRLEALLKRERPDITVSLFPSESSFIPRLRDGSKKVLELHFNRYFRLQYRRGGLIGQIDRLRTRMDMRLVKRFDAFVVLTEEDRGYWGELQNIHVIPNASLPQEEKSDGEAHRVIAVGRLDYQKGFDRLIRAWHIAKSCGENRDWRLDIFGRGEWRDKLEQLAKKLGVDDSVTIHDPTKEIGREYARSSIIAMSSHFEGFPMVLIEGMSAGLSPVTMDFKCGPRDIITNGEDGLITAADDEQTFGEALSRLMGDEALRKEMGQRAMKVTERYSEAKVMKQWTDLFTQLIRDTQ